MRHMGGGEMTGMGVTMIGQFQQYWNFKYAIEEQLNSSLKFP